jgi:hypothetical protein
VWVDRRFAGLEQVWLQPPRDAFVRVPDEILKTAVFLGLDSPSGTEYGGTGYVVSLVHSPGPWTTESAGTINAARYPIMFLVTAAHVAEKLEGFDFYIRANYKDGSLAEIKQDCSTRWWYHPSEREAVDAAVMVLPFTEVNSLDIVPIPTAMFAKDEIVGSQNLGIGDEVFIAGLFKNAKGAKKNIPIIRIGNVAMMPGEKIFFPVEEKPKQSLYANLLEARSTGGLSGSPVFIRETVQTRWGFDSSGGPMGSAARFSSGSFYFFGSMIGQWRVPVAFGDLKEELVNMGIAPMVPAQKIFEILTQPEMEEVMNTLHKQIRQEAQRKDGIPCEDGDFGGSKDRPFTKEDFEDALKKASRKKSGKT